MLEHNASIITNQDTQITFHFWEDQQGPAGDVRLPFPAGTCTTKSEPPTSYSSPSSNHQLFHLARFVGHLSFTSTYIYHVFH